MIPAEFFKPHHFKLNYPTWREALRAAERKCKVLKEACRHHTVDGKPVKPITHPLDKNWPNGTKPVSTHAFWEIPGVVTNYSKAQAEVNLLLDLRAWIKGKHRPTPGNSWRWMFTKDERWPGSLEYVRFCGLDKESNSIIHKMLQEKSLLVNSELLEKFLVLAPCNVEDVDCWLVNVFVGSKLVSILGVAESPGIAYDWAMEVFLKMGVPGTDIQTLTVNDTTSCFIAEGSVHSIKPSNPVLCFQKTKMRVNKER